MKMTSCRLVPYCEGRGKDEMQAQVQRKREEQRVQRQIHSESEEKLSLLLATSCVVGGERNVIRALLARGVDIAKEDRVRNRQMHSFLLSISVYVSLFVCLFLYRSRSH